MDSNRSCSLTVRRVVPAGQYGSSVRSMWSSATSNRLRPKPHLELGERCRETESPMSCERQPASHASSIASWSRSESSRIGRRGLVHHPARVWLALPPCSTSRMSRPPRARRRATRPRIRHAWPSVRRCARTSRAGRRRRPLASAPSVCGSVRARARRSSDPLGKTSRRPPGTRPTEGVASLDHHPRPPGLAHHRARGRGEAPRSRPGPRGPRARAHARGAGPWRRMVGADRPLRRIARARPQ